MGKAFNRLTRQVVGRGGTRPRRIPYSERMRALEVALLETMSYLATEVANDSASPSDQNLVQAYTDLKVHLEGTIV